MEENNQNGISSAEMYQLEIAELTKEKYTLLKRIKELVQENAIKIEKQVIIQKNKQSPKVTTTNNSKNFKKNSNSIKKINNIKIDKFFSYLLVFIISFVALIILLDTIKSPLINFFPGLELLLFNLFETLKDIKSFIIDLT